MTVYINRVPYDIPGSCTVQQLLGQRRLASTAQVRLNGRTLAPEEYTSCALQDGDCLRTEHILHRN